MTGNDFLIDAIPAVVATMAAFVVFVRLPLGESFAAVRKNMVKSFKVIGSSRISDHWKERVIPLYSRKVLLDSSRLAGCMLICAAAYAAGFIITGLPFNGDPIVTARRMLEWEPQLMAIGVGVAIALFRRRS